MKKVFFIPFSADFLDGLHRFIIKDGKELSRCAIVFAGKRPSLYLKKRLGREGRKPIYAPHFFSFEEFIDFIARKQYPDFTDVDYADAIWLLYQCVQSLPSLIGHPFREKGFGDFFWWGKYLLEFINQLDTENIDNEKLRSLEKNAELGYDVPESTNELLSHVTLLRDAFHAALYEKRFFTKGYKNLCALQYVKESIPEDFEKIYFAGLFALSNTERIIIQRVWNAAVGEIVLEGHPSQWPILTALLSHLEADTEVFSCEVPRQNIKVYAGIDTHSEALTTYSILKETLPGRTAIVLPSPEALFPILSFAIDRVDRPYNISLGYPLARTSLYDLINHVLNAQGRKQNQERYPTMEYLSIMLHPFVKNLVVEGISIRPILSNLEKLFSEGILENAIANKPFISLTETETALFNGVADANFIKVHQVFFRNFEKINTLYEYAQLLGDLLEFVLQHTNVRSYILSGEIFRELHEALENLKNTQLSKSTFHESDPENRRVICDFIREHLKSIHLPFETKPIEDLEIIGVLESRNIRFDTVIMLDVNEGVMPQAKKINPLIPLGIYDILGIPSPEYNEEIFRYHFYRLIKSAGNVHLLYIDSEEKPRSRYIEQLIWEKELDTRTINSLEVNKTAYKINVHLQNKPPAIEKNDNILSIIREKTFSPSAIDEYIVCPLLFYYKQILRFEEAKGFSDDIEASDRGKIIHRILHDTFNTYINREISLSSYSEILDTLRMVMAKHFEMREVSGDYYLFKKLSAYKLESFLRKNIADMKDPFILKHLETKIEDMINVDKQRVKIKGRIDRIDYLPGNDEYMIIDYKTGGTKQYRRSALKRTDFSSTKEIHKNISSFQLPIYVYLFINRFDVQLAQTNAKLILLKNNEEEELFGNYTSDERESVFTQYMDGVATVIQDILDPAKPFSPFDTISCADCAFRNLCHV